MDINRSLDPTVRHVAAGTPHHVGGFIGALYTRVMGPVQKGATHHGHARTHPLGRKH